MKKLILSLAIAILVVSAGSLATNVSAAPLFEDPQICLNGELLMVEPTTQPIEVWVAVGPNVNVDYDVVNCGGDPNLPVLDADHVIQSGVGKVFTVAVLTAKHSKVKFHWDGHTFQKNSGGDNWVFFTRRAN